MLNIKDVRSISSSIRHKAENSKYHFNEKSNFLHAEICVSELYDELYSSKSEMDFKRNSVIALYLAGKSKPAIVFL